MDTVSELVQRSQRGELDAFTEIVRRFQDMAVAFAYGRTRDRQLALDVAQDAFIDAFTELAQLRDPAAFPGWFRSVLLKQIDRTLRRKRAREVPIESIEHRAAEGVDPSREIEQKQLRAEILRELHALPEALRTTLLLHYGGEQSLADVADFLQVPLGTVKRRLHDGRARLKQRMFDMAKDTIGELRPSRSNQFVERVATLLKAIVAGDRNLAQALVTAEPELVNAPGRHPIWGGEPKSLQVAAELGQVELVALLLDQGADPDARPEGYNWSPLHLVLRSMHRSRPHRQVAELLVARGANVDAWAAAALGDVARVRALIEKDAGCVHARGPNDATPLHFAATVAVARELLAAHADPEARDCHGNIPERFIAGFAAPSTEHREVTRFLLSVRAQPADVFLACALGDTERARQLIGTHPDLLEAHTAAYDGVARLSRGATALQVAVLSAQVDVARELLALGAAVDARSVDGQTALHLAAGEGDIALARLLLAHGADRAAVDAQHGSTPLDWAEFHQRQLNGPPGCIEVAALLREQR